MSTLLSPIFERIEWAGRILKVPEWIIENELKHFKWKEISPDKIRVDMDDGSYESFAATLVLHCLPYPTNKKPYKGGLRISHLVTPEILRVHAIGMTFKCAEVDVEFGGGKMGIRLNKPMQSYSVKEMRRLIEAVAETFINAGFIAPRSYVPATDIGSTPEHMDVIDSKFFEITKGKIEGAPVTGRTVENGGIPGRDKAPALGGMIVFEQLEKRSVLPDLPKRPKVIVQGLGQVGGNFVRLPNFSRRFCLVGVGNAEGAVFRSSVFDIAEIPSSGNESLKSIEGEHCTNEELLCKPCDILVLAATENMIGAHNAKYIQAKVILELANHPITNEAYTIFRKRGDVFVIPDILGSAGGVTSSFWEWALSFRGGIAHKIDIPATEKEAEKKLTQIMQTATDSALDEYASVYQVDLIDAAWLKGMDRIQKALLKKHGGRWASKSA